MSEKLLFFDKYAGDHSFNNEITRLIEIKDLGDGSYNLYKNSRGANFINKEFYDQTDINEEIFSHDLYNLYVYFKTVNDLLHVYTVVGINISLLEELINDKKEIPYMNFLTSLCKYHLTYTKYSSEKYKLFFSSRESQDIVVGNRKYIMGQVMIPVDYTFDTRVDPPISFREPLHDYQKCSIKWMINKETEHKTLTYNLNKEIIFGNTYYDNYRFCFNNMNDRKKVTFKGGCIIDEVGLGKTIQMITLALSNKSKITSHNFDKNILHSKATLVVCPSQLVEQWSDERKKMIKDDVKIVCIKTKLHFDKYTYRDILDADLVIVSCRFFDNAAMTLLWSQKISTVKSFHKKAWDEIEKNDVAKLFKTMSKELVDKYNTILDDPCVLFHLIHFHRLIIDEFHEVYTINNYSYLRNIVPFLHADHKWIVTATPFASEKMLDHIIDYLTDYNCNDGIEILRSGDIVNYLSTDVFRRNSKDSIKQEYTLPNIREQVVDLKFTATERMMYNAYLADPNNSKFDVYLRKLCCHPKLSDETKLALSNCKTLKQIENVMINHYKQEITKAENIVNKLNDSLEKNTDNIIETKNHIVRREMKKLGNEIDDSDKTMYDENSSFSITILSDKKQKVNKTINFKKEIEHSKTLENFYEYRASLVQRLQVANTNLEGKKTTHEFYTNVIGRIRKTFDRDAKKSSMHEFDFDDDIDLLDFIEQQLDESSEEEADNDKCGICFDYIPENDIGVTKCGHIFCYQCLKMSIKDFSNCPMCRKNLKSDEIFILSYERPKKDLSEQDKTKNAFIDEVGTKLANLIYYLKESPDHCIIFSQWDDLLRKVGTVLEKNGIKNVFCRGNCYQRGKAIREFNSDSDIKVIMLSSESTASGTNLTKAKKVILLDPIYGNREYRLEQEKQAIGRAHRLGQKNEIKVVRFIIKGTIEEEIYNLNRIEDQKHT